MWYYTHGATNIFYRIEKEKEKRVLDVNPAKSKRKEQRAMSYT